MGLQPLQPRRTDEVVALDARGCYVPVQPRAHVHVHVHVHVMCM